MLLIKGIPNIYLKVPIAKNWHFRSFDFVSLKNWSQDQFLGSPTHADITEFPNFLLQIKIQRSGSKTECNFSIILILKGIMTF